MIVKIVIFKYNFLSCRSNSIAKETIKNVTDKIVIRMETFKTEYTKYCLLIFFILPFY